MIVVSLYDGSVRSKIVKKQNSRVHQTRYDASGPVSSDTMDNAGESIITDVNIADDCVPDVRPDDAVFELCVDRGGVARYTRLNARSGPCRAGAGNSSASAANARQ